MVLTKSVLTGANSTGAGTFFCVHSQSCKMSILLHEAKPSNQILHYYKCNTLLEAHKSRPFRYLNSTQRKKGSFWRPNVANSITFRLFLNIIFANLAKKYSFLENCLFPQTFYHNLPIFLHGYICHIRDILQLCLIVPFHTSLRENSFNMFSIFPDNRIL